VTMELRTPRPPRLFRLLLVLAPALPLVRLHVHFPAAKAHALSLEPQPLLNCRVPGQLDRTASPKHSLPGQPKTSPQHSCNLPRRSRKSRRPRHSAISRNLPPRNRANRPLDLEKHRARLARFLASPCHPERNNLWVLVVPSATNLWVLVILSATNRLADKRAGL